VKQKVLRQQQVEARLAEYTREVSASAQLFREAFAAACSGCSRESLREIFGRLHQAESNADDIRRSTETQMYTEALFPESRGDILGLLEAVDRVPNHEESSVRMVLHQHITIPEELRPDIGALVDACARCVDSLVEGVNLLFKNFLAATVSVGQVEELESLVDRLEAALVDRIFSGGLDPLSKILLRDLVQRLGGVADRCESAADRIRIIVAKRSA
jgi:predicted phosphate transport protein (TIGR00153 family)